MLGIIVWVVVLASVLATAGLGLILVLLPGHGAGGVLAAAVYNCWATVRHGGLPRLDEAVGTIGVVAASLALVRLGHVSMRDARRRRRRSGEHLDALTLIGQMDTDGTVWIPGPRPAAFCLAGRQKLVVVATTALEELPAPARAAVLAHERAHLAGRHHLVLAVVDAICAAMPPLPLFRTAPTAVRELAELAADDVAARRCGARVALDGHRLTVVHTDGFPTVPTSADTLVIGSGERYDLEVVLGDGAYPLVASAEGKQGSGRAIVRTSPGAATPPLDAVPTTLSGRLLAYGDLHAAPAVVLAERVPDRSHQVVLTGDMATYRWMINGRVFGSHESLPVQRGERVRLATRNETTMYHPVHLHGHTFALRDGRGTTGPRKDTVNVLPGQTVTVDFDADNPGQWLAHCHLGYHEAAGMMTVVSYEA